MNLLRYSRRQPPDISLTPLIDVIFLLLIFFMVTSHFERETRFQITLPKAEQKAKQTPTKVVEVGINRQGDFYVNGSPLANNQPQTLRLALSVATAEQRDLPLVLRVDGATPHQAVVTVLEVATNMGMDRLSIVAQPGQRDE